LAAALSDDETRRVNRLRPPAARRQLTRAKGLLRHILAHYTRLPASRIALTCSADGKPVLALPLADVHFNLSHAGDRALIAITRGRAVGVDLEAISSTLDFANLVDQFFSPDEAQAFRALAPELRCEAFFAAWTRKEATAKAMGSGIGRSPAAFHVTLSPCEPARLLAIEGDPRRAAEWSLVDLPSPPGYRQALAVAGPMLPLALCNASPRWLLGTGC